MTESENIYQDNSLSRLMQEAGDASLPHGMEERVMAAVAAEAQVEKGVNKNLRFAWLSSLATAASMLLLLGFKSQIEAFFAEFSILSDFHLSTSTVIILSTIVLGILFLQVDPLISFMLRKRRSF